MFAAPRGSWFRGWHLNGLGGHVEHVPGLQDWLPVAREFGIFAGLLVFILLVFIGLLWFFVLAQARQSASLAREAIGREGELRKDLHETKHFVEQTLVGIARHEAETIAANTDAMRQLASDHRRLEERVLEVCATVEAGLMRHHHPSPETQG